MPDPISHAEMIAAAKRAINHAVERGSLTEPDNLRAVLAHLERMQWRPIEEAPDAVILGVGPSGYKTGWRFDAAVPGRWDAVITRNDGKFKPCTHWMLLPPSPERPR